MQTFTYTNIAFISYKREDEEWAKWLQKKLEHYKLPAEIRKQNPDLEFAKNPRHVFKDTTDLSGGVLAKAIREGLDSSKFLIVICSPRAAKSEWVCKEVQDFIDSGREEYIIPFIIDGEPYAKNPEVECFPEALKALAGERELLGININENGRDSAAVKVAARVFGLRFDSLWNRFIKEEKRKRRILIGSYIVVIGILLCIIGAGMWSYAEIKKANWKMLENRSRFIAEKATQLIDEGDSYLAALLLLEATPYSFDNPDVPFVPEIAEVWGKIRSGAKWHGDEFTYSILCSPDGKFIATGSSNTITIWDAESGACIRSYKTEGFRMSYSTDGSQIAYVGTNDKGIKILNIKNGKVIKILKGHKKEIRSIAFSPNGRQIASSSDDQTIRIWDVESGKCINVLNGHTSTIGTISFSTNGKYLASGASDKTVRIWDAKTWKCVKILEGYNEGIYGISISPDGRRIASIGEGKDIAIWDVNSGKCKIIKGHTDRPNSVDFNQDGSHIVTSSDDDGIIIWDVDSEECTKLLRGSGTDVVYSPNGNQIISISFWYGDIQIWDINDEKNLQMTNDNWVFSAAFSSDGKRIVSSHPGCICVWDASNGECIDVLDRHASEWISSASYDGDSKRIVSTSDDKTIKIWDADNRDCILTLKGHREIVTRAVFSPDNKHVASASRDSTVRIWNLAHRKCVKILKGHRERIVSISYSPDGRYIASASGDKTIKIWNAESGKCIQTLKGHGISIGSVLYSHDGKLVMSGALGRTVRVWDIKSGKCLKILKGHDDDVCSVAFSPDGKQIASASADGTIRIWDSSSGFTYKVLRGHNGIVKSISYSPDGKKILSTSTDKTICVWDAPPPLEELVNMTRNRFQNRRLTKEERHKYYLE